MDKIIYRASAFPKMNKGGNEAGVVLDTDDLSDEAMQKIAKHVGFSETAFVFPSQKADYKLRYFSPITEVPLCGHATIAAFNLMRNLEKIKPGEHTIETSEDRLSITIDKDTVLMQLSDPIIKEGPSKNEIADALNMKKSVFTDAPVKIVSTGVFEIFAEIRTIEDLRHLNLDPLSMQRLCEKHGTSGLYLFTRETFEETSDTHGRNFLPVLGITEESATGTASGALACYLDAVLGIKKDTYHFEQGDLMNKPSRIKVILTRKNGAIDKVQVGGGMRFIDKIIKYT